MRAIVMDDQLTTMGHATASYCGYVYLLGHLVVRSAGFCEVGTYSNLISLCEVISPSWFWTNTGNGLQDVIREVHTVSWSTEIYHRQLKLLSYIVQACRSNKNTSSSNLGMLCCLAGAICTLENTRSTDPFHLLKSRSILLLNRLWQRHLWSTTVCVHLLQ